MEKEGIRCRTSTQHLFRWNCKDAWYLAKSSGLRSHQSTGKDEHLTGTKCQRLYVVAENCGMSRRLRRGFVDS